MQKKHAEMETIENCVKWKHLKNMIKWKHRKNKKNGTIEKTT